MTSHPVFGILTYSAHLIHNASHILLTKCTTFVISRGLSTRITLQLLTTEELYLPSSARLKNIKEYNYQSIRTYKISKIFLQLLTVEELYLPASAQQYEMLTARWKYPNSLSTLSLNNLRNYRRGKSDKSVADFYAGKSVFITGGTGFVGKKYIEKLLYSCPDVDKIYLLIRAQSESHAKQRISHMTNKSFNLFKRLKEERPEALSKIVPITGDLTAHNLGISPEDQKTLIDKVSVIVHSGALIRFREPLPIAFKINFGGTREILNLAKKIESLQALLHISTLYCATSATNKKIIEEKVYPPPMEIEDAYKIVEKYGDLRDVPPSVMNGYPNTYTFTKALAEHLVMEDHGNIPTAIIRPTLVASSKEQPYPGWLDSMNLQTQYVAAAVKGYLRVVNIPKNAVVDFIPVDFVANLMVVAATRCQRSKNVNVYNCGTSGCNPLTIGNIAKISIDESKRHNFNDLPAPKVFFIKSKWLFDMTSFAVQILPAYVIDGWRYLTGKPLKYVTRQKKLVKWRDNLNYFTAGSWQVRYVTRQKKLVKWRDNLNYFTAGSWQARTKNVRSLSNSLNKCDKEEFLFDPSNISWREYIRSYNEGIRCVIQDWQKSH